MGLLHRVYARHAPEVWEVETRLMRRLGLVRRPVAVQWIVTSACDLHCPHCYSAAGPRDPRELTTDEARRLLIDELVALGRPLLVLAGGELLLRRDVPQIVAYAKEQGLDWALHTHGRLVPKYRAMFEDHPPVLAAISLDGPEAYHDAFRGRAGSFRDALRAIETLREIGCREVVASTTVTRRNADMAADILPVVMASGADSWGLHLFAPEGRGHEHAALFPTPEQLRRVAAFVRRKRAVFPIELCSEWGSAGADDVYYRDQPFLCGAGRITCVVSAAGEVMPCTTTDAAESQGNVRQRPLREIWTDGFEAFRRGGAGAASDGRECWLQARNGNPCRHHAFGPAPEGAAEVRP